MLWQATLGDLWAVDRDAFHQATTVHGGAERFANFVAEEDGRIVGFICSQQGGADEAGILCVLVAPEFQRRGIGRALVQHALDALAKRGVRRVSVGCGGHAYFCPRVPENLPGAKAFYESLGWQFVEYVLYDMTMDVRDFVFDPMWIERPRSKGFDVVMLDARHVVSLLDFEHAHFPEWLDGFEHHIEVGHLDKVIVATDQKGDIVGSVTVFTNRDGEYDNGLAWRALLGGNVGGFAVLGVREDVRGNGIGLALAAEATCVLKERGVGTSFVGWTYLEEMYGRLGYRVWRRYHMSDARAVA